MLEMRTFIRIVLGYRHTVGKFFVSYFHTESLKEPSPSRDATSDW